MYKFIVRRTRNYFYDIYIVRNFDSGKRKKEKKKKQILFSIEIGSSHTIIVCN